MLFVAYMQSVGVPTKVGVKFLQKLYVTYFLRPTAEMRLEGGLEVVQRTRFRVKKAAVKGIGIGAVKWWKLHL